MPALVWDHTDRRRLVGLCTAITGDPDAAEDLAQETMFEAWRNAHKLQDTTGTDRWVNAIARNVCRRWARHQGVQRTRLAELARPEDVPDEIDLGLDLERGELADLLDRALAMLPEPTRSILVARYLEETSHAEIAERLGLSPDAVSMRVSRGKVMLRRVLEADLRAEAEPLVGCEMPPGVTRSTNVWCTECGSTRLMMLRSSGPDVVSFRCPRCTPSPSGRTHVFDLTNPAFSRLLRPVSRPTAILGRTAQWLDRYLRGPVDARAPERSVACTRCGHEVLVRRYRRDGAEFRAASRLGLVVDCPGCRQEVSSSLGGLALAHPDVRAFRRRHPRISARPLQSVESGGRTTVVVGYRAVLETAGVDVLFDERSLDVVGVHPTAG